MRPILAAVLAALTLLAAPAAFAQPRKPSCALPGAETSVMGIAIADAESVRRVLGPRYKLVFATEDSALPWLVVASRDNKQLLRLRHHPGDRADSYMEIEVKYGRDPRNPQKLNVYEFISSRGVKLGMRRAAVVKLFGDCFTGTAHGKNETLRYELSDPALNHPLLKKNNMPLYYAEFEFEAGRLMRFAFGHSPV